MEVVLPEKVGKLNKKKNIESTLLFKNITLSFCKISSSHDQLYLYVTSSLQNNIPTLLVNSTLKAIDDTVVKYHEKIEAMCIN